MPQLPQIGFLRLPQIIGDRKRNISPLIPISRSAWWLGIRNQKYPKGVKLGPRTTVWRAEDIQALIENPDATLVGGK